MKRFTKSLSLLLTVLIMLSSIMVLSSVNIFAASGTISYSFTSTAAGFAQGTVTLKADNGTYWLYWADDTKALADYSEITSLTVSAGQGTFAMPKYTAIPADATKMIAIQSSSEPAEANRTVAKASAVYSVPSSKQLDVDTKDALYTFGAISDPQLANDSYGSGSYPYDEEHFAAALETLAERGVNFTVSSGDTVNDQNGSQTYAAEFKRYQKILADSSYANPIYEANGNHDVGTVWDKNGNYYNDNTPFVKGTGLDSVKSTITAGKPYFEITEPTTGDHFIFMALEGGFYTNKGTQFSTAQLNWLEGLLKKYKDDGKNIFIIEHANIAGWGSGDKLTTPYYYDLGLVKTNSDVARFIKLMETYKDAVIITGHTHLELSAQYNYSDNNGTSAVMIHNSAIGGVRRLVNGSVDRAAVKGLSEGYIVEVYEDCVLFNGTNLYYNESMPQCCYIVPMTTSEREEGETTPTTPVSDNVTITLKDETGEGWMANNASEREIQLIDNATNTKYVMTSYDGYKTWSVEVPREVTDITFKRVRMSDNVVRNQWDAGERNGSLCYCVLDDAGGGTTEGNGYWDMSLREPTKPVATEPEETTAATKPVTEPTAVKTEPTVETEPTELTKPETEPVSTSLTTAPTSNTTIPSLTTAPKASSTATEPSESTGITPSATGSMATVPSETGAISSNTTESVPDDIPFYGDSDLNGKVNIKDATTVQKYAAKLAELDGIAFTQADVTGDAKVNVKDATSIQKFVAKIIDAFPVEEAALVSVGAIDPSTFGSFEKDLEDYYTYSSYDQYMALKKACMKYKNVTYTDAIRNELYTLREALYDIAGEKPVEGGEITVFFDNTKNWSTVNIYAWGTGDKNASWPGVAMTKQSDGTYSYTFSYDDFQNIIFNNGTEQTVDIAHPGNNYLKYYITGGPSNKYTVGYDSPIA
ncbi:MAG: starch-binding protein [Ruminococcus sp.]|nr:starch-binding protein [Ruminococcus sp.]